MSIPRTTKLQLIFSHYENNLAPKWAEHNPTLRVFLDSDFNGSPIEFNLDPDNSEMVYEHTVEGELKDSLPLLQSAAIAMKGYGQTTNETGDPCTIGIGEDFVYLQDIQKAHRSGKDFQKILELRIHSANKALKGTILMTVRKNGMQLGNAGNIFTGDDMNNPVGPKEMLAYINLTIRSKGALKEHNQTTTRIRDPAYIGGPGLLTTNDVPLPSAAFLLGQDPKSNPQFWINNVQTVMARNGWQLHDFPHLTTEQQAEVFKDAVCYVAQSLSYIGDSINANDRKHRYVETLKRGCEDFENALERGGVYDVGESWQITNRPSGDCEDLSKAILATLRALKAAKLDDQCEAVKGVQKIAFQYIGGMSLDSVTSAAVTGADDNAKNLGAHMNVTLFPIWYWKECLERTNKRIAAKLPWNRFKLDGVKWPVKIAEGTGMYYSEHHMRTNNIVNQYVYGEECFRSFKKPIFHEAGTRSRFYRQALTVLTRGFEDVGSPYMGFWFCDNKGYRGANFEDLENLSSNVQLLAQPPMPKRLLEECKKAVKITSPPMNLYVSGKVKPVHYHDQAERIRKAVKALNRKSSRNLPPAVLYIASSLLNQTDADSIISSMQKKQGVWKISYNVEQVCDGLDHTIRMLVWADPNM